MKSFKIIIGFLALISCFDLGATENRNSQKIEIAQSFYFDCEHALTEEPLPLPATQTKIRNFVESILESKEYVNNFDIPEEWRVRDSYSFGNYLTDFLHLEFIVTNYKNKLKYQAIRLRAVELQKIYLQVWFVSSKAFQRLTKEEVNYFETKIPEFVKLFDQKANKIKAEFAPAVEPVSQETSEKQILAAMKRVIIHKVLNQPKYLEELSTQLQSGFRNAIPHEFTRSFDLLIFALNSKKGRVPYYNKNSIQALLLDFQTEFNSYNLTNPNAFSENEKLEITNKLKEIFRKI